MKIIAGKYPEEKDIDKWVGFINNGNVNIVFLWRYAAYCRDVIKAKNVADVGLRDTAEQKILYELYLAGKGNIAAAPGTSWHEFGFAIDLNRYKTNPDGTGQYYGTINADYTAWLNRQPEILNQYGLSHAVKGEIWHIQPIETIGVGGDKSKFADPDDYLRNDYKLPVAEIVDYRIWQAELKYKGYDIGKSGPNGDGIDGDYGAKCVAATNDFKTKHGLAADGAVDIETTLAALSETLADIQSKAKTISDLNSTINRLNVTIQVKDAGIIDRDTTIATLNAKDLTSADHIATLGKENAALNETISGLRTENAMLEMDNAKLTNAAQPDEIAALKSELAIQKSSNESKTGTITSLQTDVAALKKQVAAIPPVSPPIVSDLSSATLGELIGAIWSKIKGIK
jgi:peptidoglycan hydrolase-like protein with peptidoglycan-binding domain